MTVISRLIRLSLLGYLFSAMMIAPAQVPKPYEITVNIFPGGFNWPSYVAEDKGFFGDQGIHVTLQGTTGSVAQMTGLSQGSFDIAMTAIDNIIAYVEGEGEASIGPQPDFVAVIGSDNSFLSWSRRHKSKPMPICATRRCPSMHAPPATHSYSTKCWPALA